MIVQYNSNNYIVWLCNSLLYDTNVPISPKEQFCPLAEGDNVDGTSLVSEPVLPQFTILYHPNSSTDFMKVCLVTGVLRDIVHSHQNCTGGEEQLSILL